MFCRPTGFLTGSLCCTLINIILSDLLLFYCYKGIQDLDRYLGPYPHETFKKWVSLTNHISEALLERMQPSCGRISSVTEIPQQTFKTGEANTNIEAKEENSVGEQPSDSSIRFTRVPKKKFPEGCGPSLMSKYSIDSSYVLGCMTATMKGMENSV